MLSRAVAIIAVLVISCIPAFAQDDEDTGIGGAATLHSDAPAQSEPADAVGVGKSPDAPPEPQGLKGDKGDAGEAGPQGPAGRSSPETDPKFQEWLSNRGNQHYKNWSHTGSHKEQVKRLETLYSSWQKESAQIKHYAYSASSRSKTALAKAEQALSTGNSNKSAISALSARVGELEKSKPASAKEADKPDPIVPGTVSSGTIVAVFGLIIAVGILILGFRNNN